MKKILIFFVTALIITSCVNNNSPKSIDIIFYPTPLWDSITINLSDTIINLTHGDFEYDERLKTNKHNIRNLYEDKIHLTYKGINSKYDTIIVLDTNTIIIDRPKYLDEYYKLEFKNTFSKIESNSTNDSIYILGEYENNYSNYNNDFFDKWENDTLHIIFNVTEDIANYGYETYKISALGDSCKINYQNISYIDGVSESKIVISKAEFNNILEKLKEKCLSIPFGLCMSSINTTFIRSNRMINFQDQSCEWNGYEIIEKLKR